MFGHPRRGEHAPNMPTLHCADRISTPNYCVSLVFSSWYFLRPIPFLHPSGRFYSYFDSVISTRPRSSRFVRLRSRTSRTHEDDQPTNRLPHCRAFRGQPSRRSQSAQCKGEHGQHQPCNVHPPRKSTTSTRSGAIPRGKVRSSTPAPPQFDHSSHRGHARDRMQPVVLGFTSILA